MVEQGRREPASEVCNSYHLILILVADASYQLGFQLLSALSSAISFSGLIEWRLLVLAPVFAS
jgi:hypothetical protein